MQKVFNVMIHYHGMPLSGGLQTELVMQGRHAFVSYAHASTVGLVAEISQSFALDNGAFSAWKSGKNFDIKGFSDFVKKWHRHPGFDWYVMPDVIEGDHHANIKMRASWFNLVDSDIWKKGVPVWHLHEPLEVLADLCRAYPRVAFGSSGNFAQVGSKSWWGRMAEAMNVCCDEEGRPKVKLHGLRMLDPTIFSHFPFSSADSTNVGRNSGLDGRWKGPYVECLSVKARAAVLIERIEAHASASRWAKTEHGYKNLELFG